MPCGMGKTFADRLQGYHRTIGHRFAIAFVGNFAFCLLPFSMCNHGLTTGTHLSK
jgi:hypothetical protein